MTQTVNQPEVKWWEELGRQYSSLLVSEPDSTPLGMNNGKELGHPAEI